MFLQPQTQAPEKLHKMNAEMSFPCWRCKRKKGSFYHMFWLASTCNLISMFWESVINPISECLQISIPLTPSLCLFGTSELDPWNKNLKKYVDLSVLRAKKCMTLFWKSNSPPTLIHWLN